MAGIRIIYGDGVDPVTTYSQNYVRLERPLEELASLVRAYLARDLIDKFKQEIVDVSGNKAIGRAVRFRTSIPDVSRF